MSKKGMSKKEMKRMKKREAALIDTPRELIISTIIGVILAAIAVQIPPEGLKVMGCFFFFVPFGWSVMTFVEIFLPTFLLSGTGYLIYFGIKMIISIVVGMPCFVYQMIKMLVKYYKNRKMLDGLVS